MEESDLSFRVNGAVFYILVDCSLVEGITKLV